MRERKFRVNSTSSYGLFTCISNENPNLEQQIWRYINQGNIISASCENVKKYDSKLQILNKNLNTIFQVNIRILCGSNDLAINYLLLI